MLYLDVEFKLIIKKKVRRRCKVGWRKYGKGSDIWQKNEEEVEKKKEEEEAKEKEKEKEGEEENLKEEEGGEE